MRRSRSCGRRMRRRRVRRSQSRSEPSGGRPKRRRKVRRCRVRRLHRGQDAASRSRSRTRSRSCSRHRSGDASFSDRGEDASEGARDAKHRRRTDEASEDDDKMRVWVASQDCARIIGKGGRTMRDAERRSHAKLKVQKEASLKEERYIDIIGNRQEQTAALQIVLELASFCRDDEGKVLKENGKIDGADGDDGEKDVPLVLEVLPDEVGKILGKKGETIQKMEEDSGARIELDKGSGRLTVVGTKESQDKARELLLAEVSFAKEAGERGAVLKGEAARPAAADGDDEKEGEAQASAEKLPAMRIWVKDVQAGRVIGHGGETVRDMMEKTGAEVKVQKSRTVKRGCQEREILIAGEKEQQEKALELILAEVTWARNDDGVLKTSPEEAVEPKKSEERGRRRKKGSRRRRRRDGDASQSEEKNTQNGASEAVGGGGNTAAGGDSGAKKSGKSGLWVCANCGGDHRTKECPQSNGMQMPTGMPMGMLGMPMGTMPMPMPMGMPPPMLGMPMMGMPGLPMGLMPPLHPALGGIVGSRRRRRSASRSSSCCSSSESDAARSCSASGNAEESVRERSSEQDAPAPDDEAERARSPSRSVPSRKGRGDRRKNTKRRRSRSQKVQKAAAKDGSKASAAPSDTSAPAAKATKIDFSDL